jgi:hypothetical protein
MDIVPGGWVAAVEQSLVVFCRKIKHRHRPAHPAIHGVS